MVLHRIGIYKTPGQYGQDRLTIWLLELEMNAK